MKKTEENCKFLFFGKFLHHWKQKWSKNDKQMKKTRGKLQIFIILKVAIFLEFLIFLSCFFSFFSFLFIIFLQFSSFFIIFHQFHHWKQKWF